MKTFLQRIFRRSKTATAAGLALALLALPASPVVAQDETLGDILTEGKIKLNIRYRLELVDDDLTPLNGTASTIRFRLGFLTGVFKGFQGYVEMENTSPLFSEKYNAPGPFGPKRPGRPTVADPEFTELNRIWGQFTLAGKTVIRGGRQRIILDNARFVGNVGWRQNEQTFDAVTVKSSVLPDTTVFYGYFFNVNNIVGANRNMNSHIFNVSYKGLPFGAVTAYGYLLDFDPGAGLDSRTFGIRFAGSQEIAAGTKLLYTAEYASQGDFQDSAGFSTDYFNLEFGVAFKGVTVKAGYEVLASDGGAIGFSTPLATLHKFNGWADRFLGTPANGIEDIYGVITGKLGGFALLGVFHDLSSEDGGVDYGTELDLQATRKLNKYLSAGIKWAHYNAKNPGAGGINNDVDKVWMWLGLNY